jgi:hypothetical protein
VATGIIVAFGVAVRWPVVIGVVAATFAANSLGDRNLASSSVFAVANLGDPSSLPGSSSASMRAVRTKRIASGPWLLRRDDPCRLCKRYRGDAWFCVFSPHDFKRADDMASLARIRVAGAITVAPLVIGLASFLRHAPPRREVAEGTLGACDRGHPVPAAGFSAE